MDENRNSMLKRPQCFSSGPKWKKVGKHENRPPADEIRDFFKKKREKEESY